MITQRNLPPPPVSNFKENLISFLMWFRKAELLSCSSEISEGKIATPQASFLNISSLSCLFLSIKFSRKHFCLLCFMAYAPECCFHSPAVCHLFFFWSGLAHIPCSVACDSCLVTKKRSFLARTLVHAWAENLN